MLKVADLDDSRQIPGSLLAADSSALMSDRCTGVWGSLYPSKQVGRKAEKEKRTPERLWGSEVPAWWRQERRPGAPCFPLREVTLRFPTCSSADASSL